MGYEHSPSDNPGGGQGAFSTVEVMVAIMVCGLVFSGLYAGLSSGFAFVQLARENLRAIQIMEQKMETIRLYTWDQINQAGFIPTNFVESFYPLSTQSTSGLTYTGTVTVAPSGLTEMYGPDLVQVNVNISWVSAKVVRQRQMNTLVSRYGLQQYVY
jgi:type II secretory pathway pseudopilin PulG